MVEIAPVQDGIGQSLWPIVADHLSRAHAHVRLFLEFRRLGDGSVGQGPDTLRCRVKPQLLCGGHRAKVYGSHPDVEPWSLRDNHVELVTPNRRLPARNFPTTT